MEWLKKGFLAGALALLFIGCGSEDGADKFVLRTYPHAEIIQRQDYFWSVKKYFLCNDGAIVNLSVSSFLGIEYEIKETIALSPHVVRCEMRQGNKK